MLLDRVRVWGNLDLEWVCKLIFVLLLPQACRCVSKGNFFVVVAVPIAWNATNALYEFFVIVLVLVLGLIVVPTRHRVCLVVFLVVLFVSNFRVALGIAGGDVGSIRMLVVVVIFVGDASFGVVFVVVSLVIPVCSVCGIAVVDSYCLLSTSMSTGVAVAVIVDGVGCLPCAVVSSFSNGGEIRVVCCSLLSSSSMLSSRSCSLFVNLNESI